MRGHAPTNRVSSFALCLLPCTRIRWARFSTVQPAFAAPCEQKLIVERTDSWFQLLSRVDLWPFIFFFRLLVCLFVLVVFAAVRLVKLRRIRSPLGGRGSTGRLAASALLPAVLTPVPNRNGAPLAPYIAGVSTTWDASCTKQPVICFALNL